MADEEDQEARTEAPSERRLEQAFNEGDIALSHDLVTMGAFVLGLAGLYASATAFESRLVRMVTEVTSLAATTPFGSLPTIMLPVALPLLAVLASVALGAMALTFVQTKAHLWEDRVTPDFTRVFSSSRLTRLFTKDFAVDLGLGVLKVVAVGWATWGVLKSELFSINRLALAAPGEALAGLFTSVWRIGLRALVLLVLFAGADFLLTRFRYMKKHRMTKEEVKREMKEDEGDPLMRGARKRKHRELVKHNAIADTKKADVLLVNPTHIAIAIRYRKDEGGAPKVLAKGKGSLAEVMRDTARAEGIPIVQDIPLARLLYRKVKIGGSIPQDTYKAVAAVLAFVYRLTGRAQQQQQQR